MLGSPRYLGPRSLGTTSVQFLERVIWGWAIMPLWRLSGPQPTVRGGHQGSACRPWPPVPVPGACEVVDAAACPSSLSSNSSLNSRLTSWLSFIPARPAVLRCLTRYPAPHADAFDILSGLSGCPSWWVTWFTWPLLWRKCKSSERPHFLLGHCYQHCKAGLHFPVRSL